MCVPYFAGRHVKREREDFCFGGLCCMCRADELHPFRKVNYVCSVCVTFSMLVWGKIIIGVSLLRTSSVFYLS